MSEERGVRLAPKDDPHADGACSNLLNIMLNIIDDMPEGQRLHWIGYTIGIMVGKLVKQ